MSVAGDRVVEFGTKSAEWTDPSTARMNDRSQVQEHLSVTSEVNI